MAARETVEDWIAMRSTLSHGLTALRSEQVSPHDAISDATMQATDARLETWIGEFDALLKSCTSAKQT